MSSTTRRADWLRAESKKVEREETVQDRKIANNTSPGSLVGALFVHYPMDYLSRYPGSSNEQWEWGVDAESYFQGRKSRMLEWYAPLRALDYSTADLSFRYWNGQL